jgi:AcrR family transcriptional regulator
LFAEHGWNGVSIRTIAAEAGVSLAALNYHFGAKEQLLAEIFAARAKPIADERMRRLDELEAAGEPDLEELIEAFLRPAFTEGGGSAFGGRVFSRLRARLATEREEFTQRILSDAFDESSRRYVRAFQRALPNLPAGDLAWRFNFMLGAMVYSMADTGRIQSLTEGACTPGDVDHVLSRLIEFLAAGFRAGPPPR